MPLLDVQRRGQQIGRIRIGQQVTFTKKNGQEGRRPARLDTFRFTTGSQAHAQAIADLYGGEVRPWNNEYEVITRQSAIQVTVPPRDEVVTQWYEMWTGGGCQRRCDSQTEQLTGRPCLCPHDTGERAAAAAMNPPQACKPVTRINVMIPDLPGLGVFRLDTHSYYAAVEIGDTAELMQMAQAQGVFLPAQLRIEQRSRVANGETKKYPVPVLEVLATFRDLTSGALEAGGFAAQLPPPPGQPLALTAAAPTANGAPAPAGPAVAKAEPAEPPPSAQQIADLVPLTKTRDDWTKLKEKAKEHGLLDDAVCTSAPGEPDTFESLKSYMAARWAELPAPARGRPRRSDSPEEAHAARPVPPPADSDDSGSLFNDPNWAEGR